MTINGGTVKAVVVVKEKEEMTESEVIDLCKAHLKILWGLGQVNGSKESFMNSLTLQNDDLYNDLASPGRWRV
jgi:hypothetical protein